MVRFLMEFNQLRYFQTVAKTGNVSKASEILFVTQPNISKSIARLEDEIGVQLFDHRKGKITLNEYGRVFLSSVEVAFSELTTGVQTVQRLFETSQGTLSLACSIDDFLPDLLKQFSLQHPEIGIRQLSHSFSTIIEHLLDRSLNIAITSQEIKDERIVFELLGRKDYVILVHKSHLLASEGEVHVSQLRDEKFICDSTRLNLEKLRDICIKQGFAPDVAFEVESSDLIFQLIEGNAGIALVPVPQFAKFVSQNRDHHISVLKIKDDIPPAMIGVAYHKGYVISKSAEMFIAFIREWLAGEDRLIEKLGL